MLTKLGAKIASYLGEGDYGAKPTYFDELFKQLSKFYKIADLLPYECYNEQYQLFFNIDSIGFVLETPPLVGASDEMQQEISSLFQYILPEGSSLQVMLFADPHIGAWLDRWQQARCNPNTIDLANKRVKHLNKFAWNSPNVPYSLRNFRCIISYSEPFSSNNELILKRINDLKQQLITTLEMLKLPVNVWDPEQLINTLGSIINMDPECKLQVKKRWDKLQPIKQQIADIGTNLTVGTNELSKDLATIKLRSYQATQTPSLWALHAMGQLIGDPDRDQAQIPCPFILHYGVHVPAQTQPKAKILTKATYVERQAHSPIGKYLPAILQEAAELALVREQIGRGERIVHTQLSVVLFAKATELAHAEQILVNLFLSKEWQLRANKLFHLPVFLSCLPMMWGLDRVQSLLCYQKLKTTLSTEAANLLPLQGEWCGTRTPGMLLGGRRGQLINWWPYMDRSEFAIIFL